jgi:hypothetical protein
VVPGEYATVRADLAEFLVRAPADPQLDTRSLARRASRGADEELPVAGQLSLAVAKKSVSATICHGVTRCGTLGAAVDE